MLDIIVDPFTTILLVLYGLLGQSVVLAIVGLTILIRLAILPMTMRQQRSMQRMQELSPKLRALQEKYKDDREKLVQEQMALYREFGVSPFASCLPLLIQLPIFIGLWRAIVAALASTPNDLMGLEHRILFSDSLSSLLGQNIESLIPLKNEWLWMNLALPDPYYILPIIVVITTYIQQKMITPKAPSNGSGNQASDQAAQMTRQMTTIMPLMFGFFALSYSSGLSIYFITSSIVGIIQYAAMGKGDLRHVVGRGPATASEPASSKTESSGKMVEATAAATASTSASGRRLKEGIIDTRVSGKPSRSRESSSASSGGSSSRRDSNRRANTQSTNRNNRRKK